MGTSLGQKLFMLSTGPSVFETCRREVATAFAGPCTGKSMEIAIVVDDGQVDIIG
jgi:hypothetical protein